MNKKGFVFIIDGLFVLVLFMFVLLFTFESLPSLSQPSLDLQTHQLGFALTNSNLTQTAILTDNSSTIENFIQTLPSQICARYTVFNKTTNIVSVQKNNCVNSSTNQVSYQQFLADDTYYYTKTEVWIQ